MVAAAKVSWSKCLVCPLISRGIASLLTLHPTLWGSSPATRRPTSQHTRQREKAQTWVDRRDYGGCSVVGSFQNPFSSQRRVVTSTSTFPSEGVALVSRERVTLMLPTESASLYGALLSAERVSFSTESASTLPLPQGVPLGPLHTVSPGGVQHGGACCLQAAGLVESHSHSIRARRLTHYLGAGLGRGCKCVSRHSLSLTQASKHTLAQLEEVTLNHSKPAVLVRGHSAAGTTLRPCQREAGSHPHRHVFTRLGGDSEATAGPPSHSASEEESPMEASQPRQTPRTPTKRIPPPCSTPCQHPIVHPP